MHLFCSRCFTLWAWMGAVLSLSTRWLSDGCCCYRSWFSLEEMAPWAVGLAIPTTTEGCLQGWACSKSDWKKPAQKRASSAKQPAGSDSKVTYRMNLCYATLHFRQGKGKKAQGLAGEQCLFSFIKPHQFCNSWFIMEILGSTIWEDQQHFRIWHLGWLIPSIWILHEGFLMFVELCKS